MSRTIGLRTRLTLTTVPLVLLTMTLLTVLLLALARTLYLDNTETLLLGQARMVSESAATSWGDNAALDRLAKNLGARGGARITIIALDGTVLGDSEVDPATMENHAARPEVVDLVTRQSGVSVRYSATTGREMVYAAVPITRATAMLGVARVAWPLAQVNARGAARLAPLALHHPPDRRADGGGRGDGGGRPRPPQRSARHRRDRAARPRLQSHGR